MPRKDRKERNEYMRDYILRRYHKRRAEALVLLGGKCAQCSRMDSLEIDHIDPKTKSFCIGHMWSVSKKRYDEEIKKCQLLCSDHHIEKSRVEISAMRRGIW